MRKFLSTKTCIVLKISERVRRSGVSRMGRRAGNGDGGQDYEKELEKGRVARLQSIAEIYVQDSPKKIKECWWNPQGPRCNSEDNCESGKGNQALKEE